jgi:hypothetical protein
MRSKIQLCASSCLSSADNSKSLIGAFVARQNKPRKILFCVCLFICLSYAMLVVVNRRALGRSYSAYYRQYSIYQLVVMICKTIKITKIFCTNTNGESICFIFQSQNYIERLILDLWWFDLFGYLCFVLDVLLIIVCFYTSRTINIRYPTPSVDEIWKWDRRWT